MIDEMAPVIDELCAIHPELEIAWAGGACPFQAEGTLHGMPFYLRFRHNWAELRVGGDLLWKTLYAAGCALEDDPDSDAGSMTPEEFRQTMNRLIPTLEKARIYWEFPGIVTHRSGDREVGDPATYGSWGHTPQDAWDRLHQPSHFLERHGLDAQRQAEMRAAQMLRFETTTVDDRIFPDPDPILKETP